MANAQIYVIPADSAFIIQSANSIHNGCVLMVDDHPLMILPTFEMAEFFARKLNMIRTATTREAHQILIEFFGLTNEDSRKSLIISLKASEGFGSGADVSKSTWIN